MNRLKVYILFFILSLSIMNNCLALRVGISSAPSNTNPFFATDFFSQNILSMTNRSLIKLDRNLRPVCDLCSSFNEKRSKEEHILIFKLLPKQKFQDGQLITVDAIKKSVEFYQDDKKIRSIYRFAFSKIKKVIIHNKESISFHFDHYNPDNLTDLVLLKILKIPKYEKLKIISEDDIILSGGYSLKRQSPLSFSLFQNNKEKKKRVDFSVTKNETTMVLKLVQNEIDVIADSLLSRKYSWLMKRKNIYQSETEGIGLVYLGINLKRPLLKNPKLRKLIANNIPVQKIIEYKLKNTVELSKGFFSKAFSFSSEFDRSSITLDETKKILEELKLSEKNPLNLNMILPNNETAIEISKVIRGELKKVHINLNLVINEWGSYYSKFKTGRYDLTYGNWKGFLGPEILSSVFHSENIPPKGTLRNRGSYHNTVFDKQVNEAMAEPNKEQRLEKFKLANETLMQDRPYIFLWHPKIIWPMNSQLKNLKPYPNGSFLAFKEFLELESL